MKLFLTTTMDEAVSEFTKQASIFEKYLEALPSKALALGIKVVLAMVFFFIGTRIIKLARHILKKSLTRAKADIGVTQFLDSFTKVVMYCILIFMIASSFGVDTTSILALVGSAGVALGLALQGSLSNFAGGVLILLLKPFRVGDYIKEDNKGNEGTVEEIQMFYTKLKTPDNRVIILPNGPLSNTSITNVTALDIRRLDIPVGISYGSDIGKAKEVLLALLHGEERILQKEEVLVFVDNLSESSVDLIMRFWVKKVDYWEMKWKITENAKLKLDDAGIEIPFPQLDIHQK